MQEFNPVREFIRNQEPSEIAVSVVVITYNHSEFIGECIQGILEQEVDCSWELLICDHSSSDGTYEKCLELLQGVSFPVGLYQTDRSFMQFVNGRPTGKGNFMELLGRCRGEFVAICSGDDVWIDRGKLSTQVAFLRENHEYVIVWTDVLWGMNKEHARRSQRASLEISLSDYRYRNPNGDAASSVMFRREALDLDAMRGEFSSAPYEDWIFHMLCLSQGKGARLPMIGTFYRDHESGMYNTIKRARFLKTMELIQTINYADEYFEELDYSDFPRIRDGWIEEYEMETVYLRLEDYIAKRGLASSLFFVGRRLLRAIVTRSLMKRE